MGGTGTGTTVTGFVAVSSLTASELIVKLKEEVKSLTSYLAEADYSNAINDSMRDTGWSEPFTTAFKIYWMKERAKRHLFFYLWSESASKFKYKQINLQMRFDHYEKLIKKMDEDFVKAIEENVTEFSSTDAYKLFGTKIDAGFAYQEQTGVDVTFDEDFIVNHSPNENS